MGQFIKIGLCTTITCPEREKNKITRYYKQFDDFITDFEKQTPIKSNLFNLQEENNGYVFTIKDELLAPDSLNEFLKDFFNDIYDEDHLKTYCDPLYQIIKTKQNAADLIKFAEEKDHINFQISQSRSSVSAPFMENIYLEYEYIVLYINGKAFLECYSEFFAYIEKLISARYATHLQMGAIKIFLD